ncbi:ABC transporter ATP-binding protein [Candidatus Kaiserbacteria bacterium]|nr:ABC transporter ATP-binding protein [Candidatus Kaiserbacteria bacterium]
MLHIEDVIKEYPTSEGSKIVLDNVDLRVAAGEFVALVGPSGCGKSTLLRLILGQEEATSGNIYLDGERIGHPDERRGIVYQKYTLFPNLSVLDNILLGYRWGLSFTEWRRQKQDIRARAIDYLKIANLEEHKDKYPHQLSGGQQQRAAVLQALIKDPKILMMDEPFGALDPGSRERMQVFLLEQWERTGKTIFFVTHDLEEAVFLATRVIVLSQHYTDGRDVPLRGARVVCDITTGKRGVAASTKSKLDPKFAQTIEHIRDRGFQPSHLYHVTQFDLSHPDSFHTVSPEELEGTK